MSARDVGGLAEVLTAAGHAFVRPGQVAPDLPAPDACVRCGEPGAAHLPAAERAARVTAAAAALGDFRRFEDEAARAGSAPWADWAMWAGRLAAALGSVLEVGAVLDAKAATGRPSADSGALDARDRDGLEPYCATCGEWIGLFRGLEDWQHFRGDGAPGGQRELYDAGHPAEAAWIIPAGRVLSPAGLAVLGAALADAIEYRQPDGLCTDCDDHPAGLCTPHTADLDQADAYAALARALGVEEEQ